MSQLYRSGRAESPGRHRKKSNPFAISSTISARLVAREADLEQKSEAAWRSTLSGHVKETTTRYAFYPMERLQVYLFGATVLFASFGMGEAVYRLLLSEFDRITDRIPIELLFGLVFAWLATKFVGGIYRNRKREARGTTSFELEIVKYEALWKESIRWLSLPKTSNPSG